MAESSKINFHHRRIPQITDFTELMEMQFPGNRNQQYAAACSYFELKWADGIVPNLTLIEKDHDVSRRTVQRTRAKLSRLGLIEHVSYLNNRYGGQDGWKLSSRFESALVRLAETCCTLRDTKYWSKDKDRLLLEFVAGRR